MKTLNFRWLGLLLAVLLIAFQTPVAAVAGIAIGAASLLNYGSIPFVLGTSFPVPNSTSISNVTTEDTTAREELWVRSVLDSTKASYQDAPLAEGGFMGTYTAGSKPSGAVLQKAIIEITDTSKVAGKTVHIKTEAGIGGVGVQGDNTRLGNEAKLHQGGYDLSIGRYWFGASYTEIARDESFAGSMFDRRIRDGLRKKHAKKRNDDHLMRLREAITTTIGRLNIVYPDGIASVATLKTANVFDTSMITAMGEYLPALNGSPIDTTDDSGGSVGELFVLFGSSNGFSPMMTEPAYVQAVKDADVRGDGNRLFKGGLKTWGGHGIYRWIHRDHANKDSMGSPLLPRARLGAALTAADTNSIIHGGGAACGATVDNTNADATNTGDTTDGFAPAWFEYFSNAPWTYYNGDTIAAVTSTDRYLLIINNDGTGYGCYNYRINNGKAIIVRGKVSIGVGTETYTHPVGSLIVECNVIGAPFGRTIMFGAQALVCGNGSINGSVSNPKMGETREEIQDYGRVRGIGVEGVWGNAAAKRAVDNAYPGFLLATHAVPVPGAPVIS